MTDDVRYHGDRDGVACRVRYNSQATYTQYPRILSTSMQCRKVANSTLDAPSPVVQSTLLCVTRHDLLRWLIADQYGIGRLGERANGRSGNSNPAISLEEVSPDI